MPVTWTLPRLSYKNSVLYSIMSIEKRTIDENMLEALLQLSRLSSESTNLQILKNQVDEIVGYFDILSEYADSEDSYAAYTTTDVETLRKDEVVAGLDIPNVKKITPEFMDGYFRVPKVLEL